MKSWEGRIEGQDRVEGQRNFIECSDMFLLPSSYSLYFIPFDTRVCKVLLTDGVNVVMKKAKGQGKD